MLALLERRSAWIAGGVAAAILLAGIAYSFHLGPDLRYWDEREYHTLASNLVEHGEFVFRNQRAFRPPLYPLLLAGLVQLAVPVPGLRIANFVLLAACAVLLHRLARRITGERAAGALAVLWLPAYPVLFYLAGKLYPQTLAGFLLLLTVDLLVRDVPLRAGRAAAGGIVFGLLVLTVPTFLPLLGVWIAWLVWQRHALPAIAALVLATLGTLLPWTLRNQATFGRFVFIASNSGINLLYGNCENSRPGLGTMVDKAHYDAQAEPLDEVGRDRFYRDAALGWIRAHPEDALRLYAGKLLHHFTWSEQLATSGEGGRGKAIVLGATYLPLLALAVLRLLLARRRRLHPIEWFVVALYLGHALVSAVFFTRIRFRLPVDLLLLALAATTVTVLFARRAPAEPVQLTGPPLLGSAARRATGSGT